MSRPPAVARPLCPPPPPWMNLAASRMSLPAFLPLATRSLEYMSTRLGLPSKAKAPASARFWTFFCKSRATLRTMAGSMEWSKRTSLMPFTSSAPSSSFWARAAAFSLATASNCLRASACSATSFSMAPVRSGALLKIFLMVFRRSSMWWMLSMALAPVTASIRRTPAATALSDTILNRPMVPVLRVWVPPQSSTESPNRTTRTTSPYFSPNRAMAPILRASSMVASRFSMSGKSERMSWFTRISTARSSSSVIFWKWEKSKRK